MNTFTVNGKTYKAKEFTFNMMCDLEEIGISMEDIPKKGTATLRAYFALCADESTEFAGEEMQEHFLKERNFKSLSQAMSKAFMESDFFQALIQKEKKETAKKEVKELAEMEEN